MPTYQYACTECGHAFEAVQSFSDDALTECSECSGRLRKVFSSVGIVFKGSGFYRNDSREAAKTAAAADKNGTDKGDKGSEKKDKVGAAAADSTTTKSDSAASSPAKTPAPSSSSPSGSSGGKSTSSKSSTAGTAA